MANPDIDAAKLLMARYVEQGGPTAERDRAIELFERALGSTDERGDEIHIVRLAAGTLRMLRAVPAPLGADSAGAQLMSFANAMVGGLARTPEARADIRIAAAHFQDVVDQAPPGSEVRAYALGPLAVLRLLESMDGGGGRMPSVLGLLNQATQAMQVMSAPQASVLAGLRAWLKVDQAHTLPPAEVAEVVEDLGAMVEGLPDGHQLRSSLLAELGVVLGRVGEATGSVEYLTGAPRLVEQALAEMGADDPRRADATRKLAGLLVSATAVTMDDAGVDRVVALAEQVVAIGDGRDRFLHGMALTLRGRRDDSAADLRLAAQELCRALTAIPDGDPIVPVVLGMLGALLNDRHLALGVLEDAAAGPGYLRRAAELYQAQAGSDEVPVIPALAAFTDVKYALTVRDPVALDRTVAALQDAVDGLPAGYPWRSRLDATLGLARLARGYERRDTDDVATGLRLLERAGDDLAVEPAGRPAMLAAGGIAMLLRGLLYGDEAKLRKATERLAAIDLDAAALPFERIGLLAIQGNAYLAQNEHRPAADHLDAAIDRFTEARALIEGRRAHPLTAPVLAQLARALRQRSTTARRQPGDAADAIEVALIALRARGHDVLLQERPADALTMARAAATDAHEVVGWCLTDDRLDRALEALELGRGLVLHATTATTQVAALLREAGHGDLADEWERQTPSPFDPTLEALLAVDVPNDLRPRALDALRGTAAVRRLVSAPSPAQIAEGLRELDAGALVYLLPDRLLTVRAGGAVTTAPVPGLHESAGGPLEVYLRFDEDQVGVAHAIEDVCDWAGSTAAASILAQVPDGATRIVLVATGALSAVPWHAARTTTTDGQRYLCESVEVTYAASGRQLLDVAARRPLPVTDAAVLIATDLTGAALEIHALEHGPYPGATVGAGTPEEVLQYLPARDAPGASVLHLACHAYAGATPERSYLSLATGALPVTEILERAHGRPADSPGGLIVLSACTTDIAGSARDEALTLSTAFLAAGATGAVGSRWAVSDRTTPYLMVMFHHYYRELGMAPGSALRAAQLWMLDPDRTAPDALAPLLAADPPRTRKRLASPAAWAAFCYHGR
jgi:tetratricopeptide (TPR) repeat protein